MHRSLKDGVLGLGLRGEVDPASRTHLRSCCSSSFGVPPTFPDPAFAAEVAAAPAPAPAPGVVATNPVLSARFFVFMSAVTFRKPAQGKARDTRDAAAEGLSVLEETSATYRTPDGRQRDEPPYLGHPILETVRGTPSLETVRGTLSLEAVRGTLSLVTAAKTQDQALTECMRAFTCWEDCLCGLSQSSTAHMACHNH